MSTATTKMHGGKRRGAGRPKTNLARRRQITVHLTPEAFEKLGPNPAKMIREIIETRANVTIL